MGGFYNEAQDNNNNKYQGIGQVMRYRALEDGCTFMFNFAWVENKYQDMVDRNILDGSHGNLESGGNGNSGGY